MGRVQELRKAQKKLDKANEVLKAAKKALKADPTNTKLQDAVVEADHKVIAAQASVNVRQ